MLIKPLTADNLPALQRFAETVWRRPKHASYYRWRYFDAPRQTTWLALQGERCVAALSAFARGYRNGGETLECHECFDWYTLPEMRGSGVGIRLMQTLLDSGKPVVALGGSADTLHLLPRLGFAQVGAATEFFLPLSAAYLFRNRPLPELARSALGPLIDLAAHAWFTPRRAEGWVPELVPISRIDRRLALLDGVSGFAPIPDPQFHAWLERGSATGRYLAAMLAQDGEVVAWGLARLHRSGGLAHGTILDMRLAIADQEIAAGAAKTMARALAESGADSVRACTTSHFLARAYRAAGFLGAAEKIPALVWRGKHELMLDNLSLSCAPDGAFQPLHEQDGMDEKPVAMHAETRKAA